MIVDVNIQLNFDVQNGVSLKINLQATKWNLHSAKWFWDFCSCVSSEQLSNELHDIYFSCINTCRNLILTFSSIWRNFQIFWKYLILLPTKFSEQIPQLLEQDWIFFSTISFTIRRSGDEIAVNESVFFNTYEPSVWIRISGKLAFVFATLFKSWNLCEVTMVFYFIAIKGKMLFRFDPKLYNDDTIYNSSIWAEWLQKNIIRLSFWIAPTVSCFI